MDSSCKLRPLVSAREDRYAASKTWKTSWSDKHSTNKRGWHSIFSLTLAMACQTGYVCSARFVFLYAMGFTSSILGFREHQKQIWPRPPLEHIFTLQFRFNKTASAQDPSLCYLRANSLHWIRFIRVCRAMHEWEWIRMFCKLKATF